MPPVLPASRLQIIEFFEAHLTPWGANLAAVGLTAQNLVDLGAAITAARTDYDALLPARLAAKAATQTHYNSTALLREVGSELIKTIKLFAETSNDPAVYNLAQIPPPSLATPTPPPAQPTGLKSQIDVNGDVELTWNATYGDGSFFTVRRKMENATGVLDTDWTHAGTIQGSSLIDTKVPKGFAAAHYQVTARRFDMVSLPSDTSAVRFGTIANPVIPAAA